MLHFEIDSGRGVAAYRQIMDQVKYYVTAGSLGRGDRLPSIRELARYLRVNPTTVVKAYNELAHAGIIEQRQGSGAFVSAARAEIPADERRRRLAEIVRRLWVEAGQMGATAEEVLEIVTEEARRLAPGKGAPPRQDSLH